MAVVLVFATVVQMVLGELAPKNLAIARTEPMARALSRSTLLYLRIAGPLIRLFDRASNRLLRRVGIEPVEELPHGATRRGAGPDHRGVPRGVACSTTSCRACSTAASTSASSTAGGGHGAPGRRARPCARTSRSAGWSSCSTPASSRFPVTGRDVDDVVGVVGIADVLTVPPADRATTPVAAVAAAAAASCPRRCPLPAVLDRLRAEHRQLAVRGRRVRRVRRRGHARGHRRGAGRGRSSTRTTPPRPAAVATADDAWVVPARLRLDEVAGADRRRAARWRRTTTPSAAW